MTEEYLNKEKFELLAFPIFQPIVVNLATFNEISPQINQIEVNPFHQQSEYQSVKRRRHCA